VWSFYIFISVKRIKQIAARVWYCAHSFVVDIEVVLVIKKHGGGGIMFERYRWKGPFFGFNFGRLLPSPVRRVESAELSYNCVHKISERKSNWSNSSDKRGRNRRVAVLYKWVGRRCHKNGTKLKRRPKPSSKLLRLLILLTSHHLVSVFCSYSFFISAWGKGGRETDGI